MISGSAGVQAGPWWLTAGLAMAYAGLLVAGTLTAPVVLLLAVVLLQATVVATWHRSLRVPGALGGMVVAGAAAVASDVVALAGEADRPLAGVPAVLGLVLPAALAHQLARRGGREQLNASLTAGVGLAALASLGCAYLAVGGAPAGSALVITAALSAALAVSATVAPVPAAATRAPGLAAACAALALAVGVGVGAGLVSDLTVGAGLAVAGAVGVLALAAARLSRLAAVPRPELSAALPVLVGGPVAYLLGALLVG